MQKVPITLDVNDETCELLVAPNRTLLEVLREELDLTGAKEGCGEGVCGACTVLFNGTPVRACLTLALEAVGAQITTVEGLAQDGALDLIQESFVEKGAVQCGFCTSGMLMSAKALLMEDADPDAKKIQNAMSGHVCRCTGYTKILEAVSAAADPPAKER
ncbi:MAG: (2Fe-2S)-binding protein [Desulfobacterales bacterium]|nr:(2Fe-2S)-binding protein [Desulfobacterales bacterium]